MRAIEHTSRFKRDYKREKRGALGGRLDVVLTQVVELLATDTPLPPRFKDHPLTGDWRDFRDCHLRPDLVLIYRKSGAAVLQLVRLGSHSELGL